MIKLQILLNPKSQYLMTVCKDQHKNNIQLAHLIEDWDLQKENFLKNELRKINHYLNINVENINELKKEVFEDFDIGYGVASLIITQTLNPDPDLGRYKDQINKLFWILLRFFPVMIFYLYKRTYNLIRI